MIFQKKKKSFKRSRVIHYLLQEANLNGNQKINNLKINETIKMKKVLRISKDEQSSLKFLGNGKKKQNTKIYNGSFFR